MQYLNQLDYAIIILYCVVILGMGIYLWRKASSSIENYFLAGRNLPWWALGISGMTNFLDMAGTMLIVSFLYMLGPRGLFVEFRGGAVLVLVFMMLWTGKWHYRSKCMTEAEWMIYRFGTGAGAQFARVITAVANIVWAVGMLAYLIKGAGVFLSTFLPWTPMECAIVMVGLTTLYTLLSGFYGVVYNDLFQSGIILVSVVIISILAGIAVVNAPQTHGQEFAAIAQQVTGNPDWMSSYPHRTTPMPAGYKDFEFLQFLAFIYLIRNVIAGMGTGADPRYFGARNERECGVLTFFWTWLMTFRWPMMIGFAVMGVLLVHRLFPDQGELRDAERAIKSYMVEQRQAGASIDYDRIAAAGQIVPRSLWADAKTAIRSGQSDPEKNRRLAELFGADWQAGLSATLDQHRLVTAAIPPDRWEEVTTSIVNHPDKYPGLADTLKARLGPDWDKKLVFAGYEGTVNPERILPAVLLMRIPRGLRGLFICSLIAAAMSTLAPQINAATAFFTRDIYQAYLRRKSKNFELISASYVFGALMVVAAFVMAYKTENINAIWDWIIMGLTAGIGVPKLLRLYWWRFNGAGVFWSTLTGLVAAVAQRYYYSFRHPELPDWSPWNKFFIITGVALVGAVIGTYTSGPTPQPVLENFYRSTRPFGFWGRLRGILSPAVRDAMDRENRRDIITVPFALLWQVTLFLLPMQLVIGTWKAFGVTAVLFAIGLSGVLLLWFRHLPTPEEGAYEATRLQLAEDVAAGRLPAHAAPASTAS